MSKNAVYSLLARQQPRTFKVSYATDYKHFILNHVASDPQHPLCETQRRRQREKKKEGLWWHATTPADLNKSSCVRTWARRRLRNAIKEELQARGYDENGKFVYPEVRKSQPGLLNTLRAGNTLDLQGSLRFHVEPPLVPAKYVDVRAEAGAVIEALINAQRGTVGGFAPAKPMKTRPSWNPPAAAQERPRQIFKRVATRTG
ncbi:hypothetical protein J4E86_010714 [Alternaria arbusti]|uniref:uncharacterized protein n=1 Tax=Alternaria arbusti TaxID=232088 RepID=UPI00221F196C|nr:uncharacterized protein J4E86_010714 [Alternaria arbusti]KAI4940742.1 hypothetical protein J4E86_010714 [Alternaria arbusti]